MYNNVNFILTVYIAFMSSQIVTIKNCQFLEQKRNKKVAKLYTEHFLTFYFQNDHDLHDFKRFRLRFREGSITQYIVNILHCSKP